MKYLILVILVSFTSIGFSQDSLQVITLSEKVGAVIDSTEKKQYRLFPYYSSKDFESAQLFQRSDSSMVLISKMKDGSVKERSVGEREFTMFRHTVGEFDKSNKVLSKEEREQKTNETIDKVAKGIGVTFLVGAVVLAVWFLIAINQAL